MNVRFEVIETTLQDLAQQLVVIGPRREGCHRAPVPNR
jgi:hypothetical protein